MGSDHVGKLPVEFMSGDECLFCHRNDVGPTWASNRHGRTIRTADRDAAPLRLMEKSSALADFTAQIELVIGGSNRQRFLKRARSTAS